MCGPDHPAPSENYTSHASIETALADENFVTEEFPVNFKTATGEDCALCARALEETSATSSGQCRRRG